jgi:hypothetical protein
MKNSANEPIGNKEGRQVIWQRTQINIISPLCFHLNRVENSKDDGSSEAHSKVKKPAEVIIKT